MSFQLKSLKMTYSRTLTYLSMLLLAACHAQPTSQVAATSQVDMHLYQPPKSAPDSLDKDNVYSMQIMALPSIERMQTLGRQIFFDKNLSGSGKLACASCHDPAFAYGPPNNKDVQMGGADMHLSGNRAVPSLRYRERLPDFSEHFFDDDKLNAGDQGPTGGFGWDGQFATLHAQVALPLMAKNEMANTSPAAVVKQLRKATYAPMFRSTFGEHALDDDVRAFKWMTLAIEYFQRDATQFYPYTSKYDAYLKGQAELSIQEKRGLALFNDPEKGNCANCHISQISKKGAMPRFTDDGLIAIGVPRNQHLPINQNPDFYDLGLCGPFRKDMAKIADYCGRFRTPSLRNVAMRQTFFHNGVFHSLKDVMDFYVTRDITPARWYTASQTGKVNIYDDLPEPYKKNVNQEVPFKPDAQGHARLNDAEIQDIIAFLQTLNDGYISALPKTTGITTVK